MSESSPKKAVVLSSLKADRKKEADGDWITAVDINPAIRWHVRSNNYPDFKTARDERLEKLQRQSDGERVDDDTLAKLNGELAVEHLLLGWEGLADDDEREIPFSEDFALEILTDEAYRLVRQSIYFAATKVGKSEVKVIGAAAKN